MRISKLVVAFVALTLVGAIANAQSDTVAPPRVTDKSGQNRSPGSVVKGHVLYKDTGQPAARVRVQLVPIQLVATRRGPTRIPTTMTDTNGEFVFLHPDVGEVYVVAHPADEHVSSAEGGPLPLQIGDPIADADRLDQYKKDFPTIRVSAESPVEINLRITNPHFGSISGRISSANGGVVTGSKVHAMKNGERGFGASTITDETGAYRFRGLPAGEYLVSAEPANQVSGAEKSQNVSGVLGSTYFPSTIDSRTSPPVVVSPDREVSDINITLAERSLHIVAGTVRDEGDGHPIAGATVRLNKKEGNQSGIQAAMSVYFSTTDAQGRWSVSNLPDGMYMIEVRPRPGPKFEQFVPKRHDLTVAGAEVENLTVEVSKGGRVSGQVIVELGNAPAPDIVIGIGSAFGRVETNGEFSATGVPEGEFQLSVMIRPPHAFYAKSVQVNGVDLLRQRLKTRAGEEIKDVRIVVAPASILTGRVLSTSGTPVSGVAVRLISTDSSTGPAFSRPNGATNREGVFVVGVAPGEYFVVMWSPGEPLPPHDGDSMRKLSQNTKRVTLGPGERKSIDLVK